MNLNRIWTWDAYENESNSSFKISTIHTSIPYMKGHPVGATWCPLGDLPFFFPFFTFHFILFFLIFYLIIIFNNNFLKLIR